MSSCPRLLKGSHFPGHIGRSASRAPTHVMPLYAATEAPADRRDGVQGRAACRVDPRRRFAADLVVSGTGVTEVPSVVRLRHRRSRCPRTPVTPPTAPEPEPWITRRVRLSIAALVCVLLALTGLTAPARADVTVTPAQLHRLRVRPVPDPDPERHGRLAAVARRSGPSGIYISGESRACRSQPNQTPAWVKHPAGQRLAAAADHPRPAGLVQPAVPALHRRRPDQPELDPLVPRRPRCRGAPRPTTTVGVAPRSSGIGAGSTLWYDMEAYDIGNTACRESALSFTVGVDRGGCTRSTTSPASTPAPAPGIKATSTTRG